MKNQNGKQVKNCGAKNCGKNCGKNGAKNEKQGYNGNGENE